MAENGPSKKAHSEVYDSEQISEQISGKISETSFQISRLFSETLFSTRLGSGRGGGQNVSREFANGGGGENVLQSVLSKTTFGGLRNWGWSGRCLFLLREMTQSRQKRGGGNVS